MAFPPRLSALLLSLTLASAHLHADEAPRFTISQVGLHFICTADGQPDRYSWRIPIKDTEGGDWDYKIPEISDSELESNVTGATPIVSGGRTALKVREENLDGLYISHAFVPGFTTEAYLTNLDAIHWRNGTEQPDDFTPAPGMIKERYYSNFPPLSQPNLAGRYGTLGIPTTVSSSNYARYYRLHPGYDWRNWNWTLDRDTPLAVTEKRLQALLYLDLHTPPSTNPDLNYDLTFVISQADLNSVVVNNRNVFWNSGSSVVLKTQKKIFQTTGTLEIGGFSPAQKIFIGRQLGSSGILIQDGWYDTGDPAIPTNQRNNLDLASSFFTANRDSLLSFSSGLITIRIYDTHDWTNALPIQTIQFRLPTGQAPPPDLVTTGSYRVNYLTPTDSFYNHPAVQAPHWWGFHQDGVLARSDAQGVYINPDVQSMNSIRGRTYGWPGVYFSSSLSALDPRSNTQRMPGARALIYGYDAVQYPDVGQTPHEELLEDPLKCIEYAGPHYDRPVHFGTDTVRTIACRNALIPKTAVAETDWVSNPDYGDPNVHLAYGLGFDPPEITQDPIDHKLEPHVPHTLSVAVKSTTAPTYQWRKNGEDIPDATGDTYTLSAPNKLDEGDYDVVVTNSHSSVTSEIAKLTFADPAIVTPPESQAAKVGSTVTLSVTAEGTDLTYQWRKDGRDIPKATGPTLKLTKLKVMDQGLYDVVVQGRYETVTTEAAQLKVYPELTILQQPVGGNVREGDDFVLSVKATGAEPLRYRWYWYDFPIIGASSERFVLTANAESAGEYKVQIEDGDSNLIWSKPLRVEVIGSGPVITSHPQSQTIEPGADLTLSVIATGENLTYQWRKNGTVLSKATQASLTLSSTQESDKGRYDCVVKNAHGATLSQAAVVQIGAELEFSLRPVDQTLPAGETASFSALIEGENVTYQWSYNGKPLSGAIYSTLSLPNVTPAQSGSYSVLAKKGDSVGTASASLQVLESGVLIYKMTGTGLIHQQETSQRVTLAGLLLVDRRDESPKAAFILTRKEGRLNLFEVQPLELGFAVTSAGPQTVFSEMADALPNSRSCLWLQGASSVNNLSKTSAIFAPKTLTGSHQRLSRESTEQVIESVTLKAALDTSSTLVSCQNHETLDQTIQRISADLQAKDYVEVSSPE